MILFFFQAKRIEHSFSILAWNNFVTGKNGALSDCGGKEGDNARIRTCQLVDVLFLGNKNPAHAVISSFEQAKYLGNASNRSVHKAVFWAIAHTYSMRFLALVENYRS